MRHQILAGMVEISFDAKPGIDVIQTLKAHGFRWNGRQWWRNRVSGAADVINALQRMINPPAFDGACWECGQPGKFRNLGAAAPVWCDSCNAAHMAKRWKA